ncbi:MAG: glycosyltransferase family 4 protein [Lachnospiraceae bacterium]|nr:glycosyltransferase family 4 protein [Lachnospiraceae bacterium]
MKIAMMTNSYKPFVAGVPISVERLSEGLRAIGNQVVVFAPSYDEQKEEENLVRYRSLFRGIMGGFSVPNHLDPRIEREFREGEFDLIHVHHPMMIGSTARYLAWKYQVPLVYTYHTRYEQYLHYIGLAGAKRIMPLYLRNTLRHCDMVIAPTPAIRDYLEEIGIEAPVEILPTGLSDDSFLPDEKRAKKLREKLTGGRKQLFCTVARLAKEKNLDFLLESLWYYKQSAGSCFKLVLIGEGPYRSRLEERIRELDMTEEVILTGQVPNGEIKNYCRASDLFLFTSRSETQGIVLLEAMAAGTPVLALEATGTEDIVVNGENGYMTQVSGDAEEAVRGDEQSFAEKLSEILEKKELEFLRKGARYTADSYRGMQIAGRAKQYYSRVLWAYEERKSGFGRKHLTDMLYWTEH